MRIEISDDDNGTLKMLMDFDSLSYPFPPAAPVSSHSNISEVPKNHKTAGDGGKPPPALKLCGK